MNLIDIGINLTHESFDPDRDEVVARAQRAGVSAFVITGSTVASSCDAAELASTRPGVFYATAGIHPHHASELDSASIPRLEALCALPQVVAVGECGLDYFRNFSTPAEQERAFEAQLALAQRTGLPVFLHQRDAHDRFLAILRPHRDGLSRAVAHCFTGEAGELRDVLDLDLYVGITGWICDERRGLHLREIVSQIPPDRIMVETDAPYLLPRDLSPRPRSRRNEPLYLPHVLRAVAAAMGIGAEELAALTTQNARRFFDLPGA